MKLKAIQDAQIRSRQRLILDKMNEERREKNKDMTIHIVDKFPPLESLKALTFLGSFSWTSKATGERWIRKPYAFNLGAGYVTPSDIARDYIAAKFGGHRLRCNTLQWQELIKKRKHQPLYAEPCELPVAYYLDMKSAYWQILMLGGYDVDYMPKRYLSPRSDVYDFPVPEIKLARNCLVSMGLPSGVNVWVPNYGFAKKTPRKLSVNLVLWSFVQDILHGVASDMVKKAGAVYVNTDGYIIPDWAMPLADRVAADWGLFFTIRHHGKAVVRGAGDYDIADSFGRRVRTIPRPFSYIMPREIDWLRKKVKYWSHRINMNMRNVSIQVEGDKGFE